MLISVLFFSLGGCIKTLKQVGYTIKSEDVTKIKPNKTRKAFVKKLLGSPSATSKYGDETWYYISTTYEYKAFLDPKIKEQDIVAVAFNGDHTVSSVKKYNKDDAINVEISQDATPTEGHDDSIIGQLLGNVGRFNSHPSDVTKPE